MTKTCVATFSTFVLALSFYSIQNQTGYINSFIENGVIYVGARLAVIACLLAYTFIPSVRTFFTRDTLSVLGLALMAFGVITLLSPTLFGYIQDFFSFGDTVILFESGVLARLISLELQPEVLNTSTVKYDNALAAFQGTKLSKVSSR